MAIGDSLLNGMRSYSINDALAASSIPARLGKAFAPVQGCAPFQRSSYPRPVLIDVERVLADSTSVPGPGALAQLLARLGDIKRDAAENGRSWMNQFSSANDGAPVAFDNLAIAGARLNDVFTLTYRQLDRRIAAMGPEIRAKDDPTDWRGAWPAGDPDAESSPGWGLGHVHININARHLRNPANRDGLDGLTVLDVVGARRPHALLVGLGPNHGLPDVVMRNAGDLGMRGLEEYAAEWPVCARALAGLPGVEIVVVTLMPRPSQVPCLMPPKELGNPEPSPTGPDGYFNAYVSAVDPINSGEGYTGEQVKELDRRMDAVNGDIQAATEAAFSGRGKTLLFASFTEMLARHDFKHRRGPELATDSGDRSYSNYAIGFRSSGAVRGGFCGFDHIHPTPLGYRYVAEEIRRKLPDGLAPNRIALRDDDDDFLLRPDRASYSVLDSLHPGPSNLPGGIVLSDPQSQDAERLLFRPGWLR